MTDRKYRPAEYVWIEKWGQRMGSRPYYVEYEQERAAADGAPLTAICREITNPTTGAYRWSTTDDITDEATRSALGLETRGDVST